MNPVRIRVGPTARHKHVVQSLSQVVSHDIDRTPRDGAVEIEQVVDRLVLDLAEDTVCLRLPEWKDVGKPPLQVLTVFAEGRGGELHDLSVGEGVADLGPGPGADVVGFVEEDSVTDLEECLPHL